MAYTLYYIMSRQKKQQVKVQLSARISPLARALLTLERDQAGWESDGEALEALILRASTSAEAYKMMLDRAGKDPLFAALRHAMAANPAPASPQDNPAQTVEKLAKAISTGSSAKPVKPAKGPVAAS